jgi:hypothetical protein
MPYWSLTAKTYGEGKHLLIVASNGSLVRASFHVDPRPANGAPIYVRVKVQDRTSGVARVSIAAKDPRQPEQAWTLPVTSGAHSFVLPAWSSDVESVHIETVKGGPVRVIGVVVGTVSG